MTTTKHIIDTDARPLSPDGSISDNSRWSIENHHSIGKLEWDLERVTIVLPKEDGVPGQDFYYLELLNHTPLNGSVLDYLCDNPALIPEQWKDYLEVIFWGTIHYDNYQGYESVGYLLYDGETDAWFKSYTCIIGCNVHFSTASPVLLVR